MGGMTMIFHTIGEAFTAQVRRTPDKIAIFDEERSLTYRELEGLVNSIASRFPRNTQFVGLVMNHSVEMVAALLAILKSGAAYVPAEPSFPTERIDFMMRQCNVSFVVTQKAYADIFRANEELIFVEKGEPILDVAGEIEGVVTPESPAYVLYTSGTTGFPKGVIVEHRNVCHYVRTFCDEFHPGKNDIMLQNSVCTFDIFVEEVYPILLTGGTLAIPNAETKGNLDTLMEFVQRHHVTIISGFPYLLLEMNKLEYLPESLRLLIGGGDVMRGEYVSQLLDKVEVYNTYGPSETTVCASYFHCNDASPLEDGTFPIGKAVLGVSIDLLDESLQPVSTGEVGEICIFGEGVSRGYLNSEAEMYAFTENAEGKRFYRSGDLGRWLPDGNLAFLKRKDQQVMILGRRVEPQEVENALSQCQYVEQGVVVAHLDEAGLSYLTGYIVPSSDKLNVSQLRKQLSERLPDYMIPEFFVTLEKMPILPSGKINRRALPVILKEGEFK